MKSHKLRQILSILPVIFLSLCLLDCHTAPPNVPVCTELAPTIGWCTYTISDNDFYIDSQTPYQGHDWVYWHHFMVMLPPDSYAEIKDWILKECVMDQTCTGQSAQVQKKIEAFESHLRSQNEN